MLKRRPKTPCVIGSGLSQFGQPGDLQSIPALQFRSQLWCQTIVWLQGQPWCGLKQLLGALSMAGTEEAGSGLSKGNHICCVPSCMFLPALVGTCYCFMTVIIRVVGERLSGHKTEAKCLFGHTQVHSQQKSFLQQLPQLVRPVTINCSCWSTVPVQGCSMQWCAQGSAIS